MYNVFFSYTTNSIVKCKNKRKSDALFSNEAENYIAKMEIVSKPFLAYF